MSKTKCQIIEDCPDFMYGCCQKYLDGDCSAHKCDLKIIRELQQKLQEKEQECEELKRGIVKQCPICGEQFLSHIGAELFEENTRLKQALDEIEEFCIVYSNNHDAYETVYKHILDIINKAKENNE